MQGYLIRGLPIIKEGDDIAALVQSLFELQDKDVLCIASTIVAKSEGRFRNLEDYAPSSRASEIASSLAKDYGGLPWIEISEGRVAIVADNYSYLLDLLVQARLYRLSTVRESARFQ